MSVSHDIAPPHRFQTPSPHSPLPILRPAFHGWERREPPRRFQVASLLVSSDDFSSDVGVGVGFGVGFARLVHRGIVELRSWSPCPHMEHQRRNRSPSQATGAHHDREGHCRLLRRGRRGTPFPPYAPPPPSRSCVRLRVGRGRSPSVPSRRSPAPACAVGADGSRRASPCEDDRRLQPQEGIRFIPVPLGQRSLMHVDISCAVASELSTSLTHSPGSPADALYCSSSDCSSFSGPFTVG